jgi:hypothetical protein
MIFSSVASIVPPLFFPRSITVERWMLASDDATLKAILPKEMFQDWETKKQAVGDLVDQREKLAVQLDTQHLGPLSASPDYVSLELKIQKASTELRTTQTRIEQYINRDLLAEGKFIARGFPNEAPPHDNEQIIIKPAQWQYLRIYFDNRGNAVDVTTTPKIVFKGVEIGKPKEQAIFP